MNKKVQLQDLGKKDYKDTWDYQEELFKEIVEIKIQNRQSNSQLPTPNFLLYVEHPHVYTLGKSGDVSNLLLSEKQLEAKGATFYKINRGGDITYHGPGQIVGYPILDLENFFTDIHKYLRFLEEAIILTLAEYGLTGTRSEGETGVWFDVGTPFARKICAMGVRASRWITMHGFALNVNADLGYFDKKNYLYISGRIDNMIKISGYRIDGNEIQNLTNKVKNINNSIAFPIKKNDYINELCLAVETYSGKNIINEIKKKLIKNLPSYSLPKKILIFKKFPLNINNKIDRNKIIKKFIY